VGRISLLFLYLQIRPSPNCVWAPKSKPIRVGVANHDRHFMVSHAGTQALLPHPLPRAAVTIPSLSIPHFFFIPSNPGSRRKASSLPRHPGVTVPMVFVSFSQIRLRGPLQYPFVSAPFVGLAVFLEAMCARALGDHRLNFVEDLFLHSPFPTAIRPLVVRIGSPTPVTLLRLRPNVSRPASTSCEGADLHSRPVPAFSESPISTTKQLEIVRKARPQRETL